MQNLSELSVQFVKGVGPSRKKLFANLGVETVEDLLYFFPRRYEDRRNMTKIAQAKTGEWQTIKGKVVSCKSRRSWHTRKHVTEVLLDDGSGRLICTWFNQPYLHHYFKKDVLVICYGKVDLYKSRLEMISPEHEVIDESESDEDHLNVSAIVPVYPLTRGLTQRFLRKTIRASLDAYAKALQDMLPVSIRNKYRLTNMKDSIESIHFPAEFKDQESAIKRISFEEFFFFQVSILLRRINIKEKQGVAHKISDAVCLKYIDAFSFPLTAAQKRVIGEIRADMKSSQPMLRLLQGDVGSGKTIVALFGCLAAFKNKTQSAMMAPTEILARQHYQNVSLMMDAGILPRMKVVLLISALKAKEKQRMLKAIKAGLVDLVIGTHSLISDAVEYKSLSYVIIDEQHKFGVRQRAILGEKGHNPDVLIMTATPIPRTLCITLYGDLDLSIIDQMPPNRGEVKTRLYNHNQSQEVYDFVRTKLKAGVQAYFIYPLVEESEKMDLKAAQEMFHNFKESVFKDFRCGLMHGQMKTDEAQSVMKKFKNKEIDLLVATTVVEVGVDVVNASVMVIEHADRFGLAQLHQLRGRIGRGNQDGFCFLIANEQTQEGQLRLKAILSTRDGFKIAQEDLAIRGPGRFFGRHQHGLTELKVANPATQLAALEVARKEAINLTNSDPCLIKEGHQHIKSVILARYPGYLKNIKAG